MNLAAASWDYPLLDLIWTMLVFFGFVIWMWLLFVVLGDVLRRDDIGGWAKAGWTVLMVVLPMIGVLVYLIAQGRSMADRRRAAVDAARRDFETDVRAVVADTPMPTDQIREAKRLRDAGDITQDEFEILKRRALGQPAEAPMEQAR